MPMVYCARIVSLLFLGLLGLVVMAQEFTLDEYDADELNWEDFEEEVEWERRLERSEDSSPEDYSSEGLDVGSTDWESLTEGYDYTEEKAEPKEPIEWEASESDWDWSVSPAWKYVLFGFVLLILVIVLFRLLTDQRASNVAVRNLEEELERAEEDIADADLLRLLERAKSESNLRMMIRIRYLMLIQKLDEAELISYRKDRSNWSYHGELVGVAQQRFGRLTRIFDYIWYGNVLPTQGDEEQVAKEIDSFMQELSNKDGRNG